MSTLDFDHVIPTIRLTRDFQPSDNTHAEHIKRERNKLSAAPSNHI